MKLALATLAFSFLSGLVTGQESQGAEDNNDSRNLMGIPSFIVAAKSSRGSKVAWRVFEKDDHPLVQDPKEVSVEAVPATKYRDGETRVHLERGQQYCLRVYKGDDESEYGSRWGRNYLEVLYFDGINRMPVKDSKITMYSPGLKAVCFTAKEDLMAKYPPDLVSCRNGNSWAEKALLVAAIDPIDSYTAKEVSEEAWEVSTDTDLSGEHDGKRDAFRHCYFTCRLTQEIGIDEALEAGDIHESCFYHGKASRDMDLYNNRVGAEIGDGTRSASICKTGCLNAAANGDLVVLSSRRLLRGNQLTKADAREPGESKIVGYSYNKKK